MCVCSSCVFVPKHMGAHTGISQKAKPPELDHPHLNTQHVLPVNMSYCTSLY